MTTKRIKSGSGYTPDYYTDQGCEIAPSCLNCPLEICRYDLEGETQWPQIVQMLKLDTLLSIRDMDQDEIGSRLGVSTQQARRLMAMPRPRYLKRGA